VHVHHCAGYKKWRAILRIVDAPVSRYDRKMSRYGVFCRSSRRRDWWAWRLAFPVVVPLQPRLWGRLLSPRVSAGNSPRWGAGALPVSILHQSALCVLFVMVYVSTSSIWDAVRLGADEGRGCRCTASCDEGASLRAGIMYGRMLLVSDMI
jgi:hypothetical protein